MFSSSALLPCSATRPGEMLIGYPEAAVPEETALQALYGRAQQRLTARRLSFRGFRITARRIEAASEALSKTPEAERARLLAELRAQLRAGGFVRKSVIELLGHIHHAVREEFGFALHPQQLYCAWALLHGALAEMATGEGKSLTAAVAATVAAIAGVPVHVITTNDYLVARDAESASRLFRHFALSCDFVVPDKDDDERRAAYGADICYVSNKQLVFDYLRDRQVLGNRPASLRSQLRSLFGSDASQPLLRGLCFAIVDEADSVLIDDANTPLILSQQSDDDSNEAQLRTAIALAQRLDERRDFRIDRSTQRVLLTADGEDQLADQARGLDGVWKNRRFRHALVRQALSALYLFQRDCEYLVRDGEVLLIDQSTGRVMPDRKLQQGLHQMVEIKEQCALSGQNQVLASLSFQNFFKRYEHLCGMTGTAREAAGELTRVYGLRVVPVPSYRRNRRRQLPSTFVAKDGDHVQCVVERVRACHETGRPVLVGTRSVAKSEQIAIALEKAGLPRRLLNARQDGDEAQLVSQAGARGAITIATNMAGRGTDIPLTDEVEALGGLHVIVAELNENRRVDRQLIGRCARQGDPGSFEYVISVTEQLLNRNVSRFFSYITPINRASAKLRWSWLWLRLSRSAQRRCEKRQKQARRQVAAADLQMQQRLSFTGFKE